MSKRLSEAQNRVYRIEEVPLGRLTAGDNMPLIPGEHHVQFPMNPGASFLYQGRSYVGQDGRTIQPMQIFVSNVQEGGPVLLNVHTTLAGGMIIAYPNGNVLYPLQPVETLGNNDPVNE